MSTSIAKSDCGCGGQGSTPSGGCGCGEHGGCGCGCGGATCADGGFKRPRFFAGQLLTEDDLQALTDYVVGKNRLHNRFLFGDGVVCGLAVTCHPCGVGKVIVAPGFALDCCGNDIPLPCKQELDVKALIRSLRARQLAGYDCGDPCDEKTPGDRTYGLFLVYTETMEDPVAPYASGDPCGQQACEPTRICEGYRFELRCECALPTHPDVFTRILACIGDLRRATAAISKAQETAAQATQYIQVARALRAEKPPTFDPDSLRTLQTMTAELNKSNKILDAAQERDLRLHVARLQMLAGTVTRFRALPKEDQDTVLELNKGFGSTLERARGVAREAADKIETLSQKILTTPLARIQAADAVRATRDYVVGDGTDPYRMDSRLVALNTPISSRQVDRVRADAAQVKEWLLDKLDGSPSLTRCDLADRLRRIRVDTPPAPEEHHESTELTSTGRAVRDLVQILFEYLIDCICAALNPPCQPCEEQGVLLACLTVRECEVVDICNLSRRFVLSAPALRYWLPPIGAVGDLVKRLCCDLDLGRIFNNPKAPVEPTLDEAQSANGIPIVAAYAPSVGAAEVDDRVAAVFAQFRIEPRDVEAASFLASNLALLSVHAGGFDLGALARRGLSLGDAVSAGQFPPEDSRAADARLRERVAGAVAEGVEGLQGTLTEGLQKRVADDVKSAVARELTDAKLRRVVQDAEPVKALREESRRLARELKELNDAVTALRQERRQ